MEPTQIQAQVLEGCQRLAAKGFLHTPADSFSMRIPGCAEMIFASAHEDWQRVGIADLETVSLLVEGGRRGLHASIYKERADVGAVVISSPQGVRLLAHYGGLLPPLFDEQVRHIGLSVEPLKDEDDVPARLVRETFRRGTNAALLGEQLLCLGMTCERVLCNTELYEKCAQAYVIAKASGHSIRRIPEWVQLIANRRLIKDERRASASYHEGRVPEGINAY